MTTGPDTLCLRAPAKINLYLKVLGQRKDGYHEIQSVVVPLALYDTVTLEKTRGDLETVVEKGRLGQELCRSLARSEDNLTTRAAALLKAKTGYGGGARIRLKKAIPLGSGLGGGSSDAACVLTGLNQLWGTGLGRSDLMKMATRLGSDVPVMVHGMAAGIGGRGERVSPIRATPRQRRAWWLVVINPGFAVSTADIYTRHNGGLTSPEHGYKSMVSAVEEGDLCRVSAGLFNSLQPTVFRKYPLIEIVAEQLEKAGALGVLLSGSGATVFGLARDRQHALAIRDRATTMLEVKVWSKVARTLPDGVTVAHGPLEA